METPFTEMMLKNFPGQYTFDRTNEWDYLPVVIQESPQATPYIKNIPPNLIPEIRLKLPDMPSFNKLGLRWYGLASVTNI